MNRYSFALLLASGLFGAASAQGGIVVYAEDFEDDTIGALPTITGSNVGGGYQNPFNAISVESNPEALGNTSSQVLEAGGMVNNSSWLEAKFDGGAQSIDGMTVSWDFYNYRGSEGSGNDNDSVRVAFFDGGSRDNFMRNDRDTLIKLDGNDQGDGAGTGLNNFGENVWQNFVAVFTDTGNDDGNGASFFTLDWTLTNLETNAQVNGSQQILLNATNLLDNAAEGLLFEVNDTNDGVDNYLGYYDNVTVEIVPEPASLALLAMGGLLMTSRRRRG